MQPKPTVFYGSEIKRNHCLYCSVCDRLVKISRRKEIRIVSSKCNLSPSNLNPYFHFGHSALFGNYLFGNYKIMGADEFALMISMWCNINMSKHNI